VIIDTDLFNTPLVLWTNRAVTEAELALAVYADWQRRPTIEHLHRFIQEDGLLVEDMQLEPLESKRRLFLLILAAALFVLRLPDLWEPSLITWVRQLASAIVGTAMDREGFYLLLYGVSAVLTTLATLHAAAVRRPSQTYG
jgi:DMSO reductase anchor subunit